MEDAVVDGFQSIFGNPFGVWKPGVFDFEFFSVCFQLQDLSKVPIRSAVSADKGGIGVGEEIRVALPYLSKFGIIILTAP